MFKTKYKCAKICPNGLFVIIAKGEIKMAKYHQLNAEQREIIQSMVYTWNVSKNKDMLNKVDSFTQIGNAIGKDRRKVVREVKKHRFVKTSTPYNQKQIIEAEQACDYLKSAPHVCNGCQNIHRCLKHKLLYNAGEAQKLYKSNLSESRKGIDIKYETIEEIENSIVPLIKDKKQSINQVYVNHSDVLYFSKPTFYKYVNIGVFSLKNIDLPRKVKYKPRHKKHDTKRELALLNGRRHSDFGLFISNNPNYNIVEMDTVIGQRKTSKVLLTIYFRKTNFMLIRLLDKKNIACVNAEFDILKEKLGIDLYKKVFRVVLTDNGIEFFDPYHVEMDYTTNKKVCNLFYCDAYSPGQKGGIEKNHEYIRFVLPKGSSFDELTKEQIKNLEDNINNIPRDSLDGKTPYELTLQMFPDFIKKLDCHYISPNNVSLTQDILEVNHEIVQ